MKKIWIAIMTFLVLVTLYAQTMEGENVKRKEISIVEIMPKIIEDIRIETEIEVTEKDMVQENLLTIHLEADKNITRDHLVKLTVHAENVPDMEWCNFWWKEGDSFLGMGEVLETTFKKGIHLIIVIGKDTLGHESNASMKIIAWEYTKKEYLHYSDSTGEFIHKEIKTYDHNEHLILKKGNHSRTTYLYNKGGSLLEEQYENELNFNLNYTKTYEYDEQENNTKTEEFDANGQTRWYESMSYSEEGAIESLLMGEDINQANSQKAEPYEMSIDDYYHDNYDEEEYKEEEVENEALVDKNGNLLHDEIIFGKNDGMFFDYRYNDKNQTVEKRVSIREEEHNTTRVTKYNYNENGEVIGTELLSSYDDNLTCHYTSIVSYTETEQVYKNQSKILGGDCRNMVKNLYEEYIYNEEGEIIESKIKAYHGGEEEEANEFFRTLKVYSYYSNSLED